MIVYPQFNSVKYVLLPMALLLIALGIYSYKSYNSLEEYKDYVVSENELIEKELADMVLAYHDLEIENDSVLNELALTKAKIFTILDSIQSKKPNLNMIARYKQQLSLVKAENTRILRLVTELERENTTLKTDLRVADKKLKQSKQSVKQYKNNQEKFIEEARVLTVRNSGMEKQLDKAAKVIPVTIAAKVIPGAITVQGVKRLKSNSIIVYTKTARRTKKVHTCFTIPANALAKQEQKTFYLQLKDTNQNVVGVEKTIYYKNGEKLDISKVVKVNYANKAIDICEFITYYNDKKRFEKGSYTVNLYNEEGFIAQSSIYLK